MTNRGSNFGAHESWNSNESSQGYGDSYNKADRHHDNSPLWQLPRHLQAIAGVNWGQLIFLKRHLRAAVKEFACQVTFVLLFVTAMFLHADQNLAAPNLSAIANDFQMTPMQKDGR